MKKSVIIATTILALASMTGFGCARSSDDTDESSGITVDSTNPAENAAADHSEISMVSLAQMREETENFTSSYTNLDFTDTVFSMPEADTIRELTYEMPSTSGQFAEMEDKILSNMDVMAGSSDIQNLKWMLWDEDRTTTAAIELTDEEKAMQSCLVYNDGEYTALLYCSSYMLEMGDSALWADLEGASYFDENYKFTCRPMFVEDKSLVASYDLSTDSMDGASYTLMDGEISVADAVDVVESEIKKYYYIASDCIDFKVSTVDVYELADGTCYYDFVLSGYIDGIKISDFVGYGIEYQEKDVTSEDDFSVFGLSNLAAMIYTDRLSYVWGQCGYNGAEETEVTEVISLDDACYIVSSAVSSEVELKVSEVSMEYDMHQFSGGDSRGDEYLTKVEARLVYAFYVDNPRVLGYSSVRFAVDAVTGELYTMYN